MDDCVVAQLSVTEARCERPSPRPHAVRGFTLIEMLVVMVLLGLLSALALPAMQRWHDAVQAKAQAAVLLDGLRAAAFAAAANRRNILMDESSFTPSEAAPSSARTAMKSDADVTIATDAITPAAPAVDLERKLALALPTGWSVKRVVAATFMSNGLCRPGLVALQTEHGDNVTIQVRGPVCGVEFMAGTGQT